MKKVSRKQRERDVKKGIRHRKGPYKQKRTKSRKPTGAILRRDVVGQWIYEKATSGELDINIDKKRNITLFLPDNMNFYADYESTVLYMSAIRKLSNLSPKSNKHYRLRSVNIDNLKSISTSAALVLTAELSKWDDAIRQKLIPDTNNWNPEILQQFKDLGFFGLFKNSPINLCENNLKGSDVNFVKYIKGKCGDNEKVRLLKKEISEIVGNEIKKWTFLHSGLIEAITNVTHHAYPNNDSLSENSKNWYLSGSYNRQTKELKVVFYDQGIGIPKTLPSSRIWERILSILSSIPTAERKRDEVLLKAAVQISRTSTGEPDRGRGLQDLLEFIRQRQNGYLSIMSLKGLFKFMVEDGVEKTKSEHFHNKIQGTLIIWCVTLD